MKRWILKIEACGETRADVEMQIKRLLTMDMRGSKTNHFSVSNLDGSAQAVWTEHPVKSDEENHP